MAIVQLGGVVTGIRGKVGGVIYSANKSGPYARTWSRGANVRSELQTTGRGVQAELAQTWRTLDAGDRADWDLWAADPEQELTNVFGEAYYISGFLWFVKINRWLNTVGRAVMETVPTSPAPTAPSVTTLVVSAGDVDSVITYPANEFGAAFDCVIELAIGQSVGAAAMPIKPMVIGGWQVPGGTSLTITDEVLERCGNVQVGQRAFARVYRQTAEGYRSAPSAIASDVVS